MAETDTKPVQILKKRRGGISDRLKSDFKEQNRIHKAIKAALKEKPLTLPELAGAIEVPAASVVWHTMALKRYGDVVQGEVRGDYYTYALKEEK